MYIFCFQHIISIWAPRLGKHTTCNSAVVMWASTYFGNYSCKLPVFFLLTYQVNPNPNNCIKCLNNQFEKKKTDSTKKHISTELPGIFKEICIFKTFCYSQPLMQIQSWILFALWDGWGMYNASERWEMHTKFNRKCEGKSPHKKPWHRW